MDNYVKQRSVNHRVKNPFSDMIDGENACKVQISEYSHLNKVIGFAKRKLQQPSTSLMLVHGQGKAVGKVRSCVQILTSKQNNLHRCDAMAYKVHEDIWVPVFPESDLDSLSVKRHIPVLFVILAKDDLPPALKSHPQRLQLKNAKPMKEKTKSQHSAAV